VRVDAQAEGNQGAAFLRQEGGGARGLVGAGGEAKVGGDGTSEQMVLLMTIATAKGRACNTWPIAPCPKGVRERGGRGAGDDGCDTSAAVHTWYREG